MTSRFNEKTLITAARRVRKRAGLVWRLAALALATMLPYAPVAHTLVVEGDDPPPSCSLNASLSATPSSIDRNTSASVISTLTWSVTVPPQCTMTLGLYLTGTNRPVGKSGQISLEVLKTTTYELKALLYPGQPTLASATVTVSGDPGLITVSSGPTITAADLAEFNAQWMQPYQKNEAFSRAFWNLFGQNPSIVWEVNERMEAMVRMYDLTHDPQYLDHLKQFVDCALRFRDDYHPGSEEPGDSSCPLDLPPPALRESDRDPFRGNNVMPAWGAKTAATGGLHYVDEISFGYAYPIAAFARIVAEHPDLYIPYGADAIRYTNEIIKTVQIFFPQLKHRQAGGFTEATLKVLDIFPSLLTPTQCNGNSDCLNYAKLAGSDMAHNWNQAYIMLLTELWKVLDNPWYRSRPDAHPAAGLLHTQLPVLVSRLHRNFINHLETVGSGDTARFVWNYNDGLTSDDIKIKAEDTSHGALDMRGLEVLRATFARLNVVAAAAGEPIELTSTHLQRFANTFLQKIAAGSNFKKNVNGDDVGEEQREDHYNFACDGWMNLAVADLRVYHKCHEVSLRVVNGLQPYLSIGNHSALLMNKRLLPAQLLVPNVTGKTLTGASGTLTAAGFVRGTVRAVIDQNCDGIELVTSQSPAPGTLATPGARVNLSVQRETGCLYE